MWITPLVYVLPLATYNSFRQQIGYCMMQSFDTLSRNTSMSVPMFMDGRISFGVGLSNKGEETEAFPCGMCINITEAHDFFQWNPEITEWIDEWPVHDSFLAAVFDQCTDPICTDHFLDFDVYSVTQPVQHGNPRNISWHIVPCPLHPSETFEYIVCTSSSCHAHDDYHQATLHPGIVDYWSIVIRNLRYPLKAVWANNVPLLAESSWSYSNLPMNLSRDIHLTMIDYQDNIFHDTINIPLQGTISPEYRGGIFIHSTQKSY